MTSGTLALSFRLFDVFNPLILASVTFTGSIGYFSYSHCLIPTVFYFNIIGFILASFYVQLNKGIISTLKKWWQQSELTKTAVLKGLI